MGLDASIKRADGLPLGNCAEVQEALSSLFIGLAWRRSSTGHQRLESLANEGVSIPDFIRQQLAEIPVNYESIYQSANFSVEFYMAVSEPVLCVNAVLRGTTTASEPFFALLKERFDWITTHP